MQGSLFPAYGGLDCSDEVTAGRRGCSVACSARLAALRERASLPDRRWCGKEICFRRLWNWPVSGCKLSPKSLIFSKHRLTLTVLYYSVVPLYSGEPKMTTTTADPLVDQGARRPWKRDKRQRHK